MDSFVFNKQSIPVFLRVEMLGETNDNRIMAEVKETGCVVFAKDKETLFSALRWIIDSFKEVEEHAKMRGLTICDAGSIRMQMKSEREDEETFWNLTFDDLPYFSVMGDNQERLHGFLKRMIWIAVHFPKQW